MCRDRFEKKKIFDMESNIKLFSNKMSSYIESSNYNILFEDESTFEIDKSTNRILMIKWDKYKIPLEAKLHQWKKIAWYLSIDWKAEVYEMLWWKANYYLDTLKLMRKNNNKKLLIIFVDNYVIHFTIDILKFCIENMIALIPLPKYSPDLNPIERLWKALKRDTRMVYSKLDNMREWIKEINNYVASIFASLFKTNKKIHY